MLANPQPLSGAGIWYGLIGSCFIGVFLGVFGGSSDDDYAPPNV
jgi:MFS superfamily sulfate permease-like transporter